MVSLFCGNGSLDLKVDFGGETYFKWSPAATATLRAVPIRCRSLFRTTTVKLIGFSSEHRSASLRNRDRHQFGTLIAIPRNPQPSWLGPAADVETRIDRCVSARIPGRR